MVGASYGSVLFDFNTPGQLTGNFSSAQSGLTIQSGTGGLNNSGSLDISATAGTNAQIFTLNTPFSGDLGSWRVSFYYKGDANLNPTLGVTTQAAPIVTDGQPGDGGTIYYPIIYAQTGELNGGTLSIASYNGIDSTESKEETVSGGLSTAANWYFYELTVSYTGSNNFSVTGTVNNASSDGTVGSQLVSASQIFNNPAIAGDSAAYIYFQVNGGVAIDNLSTTAVPEPTTIGLLAGAGLAVFAAYRRRVARA